MPTQPSTKTCIANLNTSRSAIQITPRISTIHMVVNRAVLDIFEIKSIYLSFYCKDFAFFDDGLYKIYAEAVPQMPEIRYI